MYKVVRTCLAPSQLVTDVHKRQPFVLEVVVMVGGAPQTLSPGRQLSACREPRVEKAAQSLMPSFIPWGPGDQRQGDCFQDEASLTCHVT